MQEITLTEFPFGGMFVVDSFVNLDDLVHARAGGIVRIGPGGNVHDSIRYINADQEPYQCVAGWVSENV